MCFRTSEQCFPLRRNSAKFREFIVLHAIHVRHTHTHTRDYTQTLLVMTPVPRVHVRMACPSYSAKTTSEGPRFPGHVRDSPWQATTRDTVKPGFSFNPTPRLAVEDRTRAKPDFSFQQCLAIVVDTPTGRSNVSKIDRFSVRPWNGIFSFARFFSADLLGSTRFSREPSIFDRSRVRNPSRIARAYSSISINAGFTLRKKKKMNENGGDDRRRV